MTPCGIKSLTTALLIGACWPAAAQEAGLNIFNWDNYIGSTTLAQFEAETGIRPVYNVYDSNETLEARLLAGNSNFDIAVPTGTFLSRQIEAGVYRRLDREKLSNYGNLDRRILELVSRNDPGNAYAVPYMWGTTGIGYNKAMIRERLGTDEITSWDVLFDPANAAKLADCGIAMLDSPSDVVPSVLNYLDLGPYAENADELGRAMEVLKGLRPHLRYFHASQYSNDLASGAICVAIGYSGDILQSRARAAEAGRGVEIGYSVPEEGAMLWVDMMAIPADAPHPDNAHTFLDFVLRPAVAAELSNEIHYASGNKAAVPLLKPDVANDPASYPPPPVMDSLFVAEMYSPRFDRQVTRAWTELRTGR